MDLLKLLDWLLERKNEHQINKSEIIEYINKNILSTPANDYQSARKQIKQLLSNFKK